MKLNLGCGNKNIPGWTNVDIKPPAEVVHDLNVFPWPFENDQFEEIQAIHVLEHLGNSDPMKRIGILKELYRISKNGCMIKIIVPNPFHKDFMSDPTHCWPITEDAFLLFDKKFNQECIDGGFSNSTLGLDFDIDFAFVKSFGHKCDVIDPPYIQTRVDNRFQHAHLVNSVSQIEIYIKTRK